MTTDPRPIVASLLAVALVLLGLAAFARRSPDERVSRAERRRKDMERRMAAEVSEGDTLAENARC